jgi:hypothetical protein
LNEDLAATTAPLWIRNAVPVLDAPLDIEYVPVIPLVVAGFRGHLAGLAPETELIYYFYGN